MMNTKYAEKIDMTYSTTKKLSITTAIKTKERRMGGTIEQQY